MLNILGISMRNGNYFRVMVESTKEMNEKWLEIIHKDCDDKLITFEEAMKFSTVVFESCYTSNKDGYLIMEIEIDLDKNTSNVVFYFDDYEDIDIEISKDEYIQCVEFINQWKDKLPDNNELMLGDNEWYEAIPDDVDWK